MLIQPFMQDCMNVLEALNSEHKMDQKAAAPKKKGMTKWIKPVVENFKRTQLGNRLVSQEAQRLLEDQAKWFPTRPMLTMDRKDVRYTESKINKQISLEDLKLRFPKFFSCFFQGIRNKLQYGLKVSQWLQEVSWLHFNNVSVLYVFAGPFLFKQPGWVNVNPIFVVTTQMIECPAFPFLTWGKKRDEGERRVRRLE